MKDWAALDKQYVWHPFTQMDEWIRGTPLVIERAEGNYLIDTDGNRYLDGVSSLWVNVHGHRKQEIDDAVRDQLNRIAHSTLLGLSGIPSIELAEKLVKIAPEGLTRVFYSDSGSTATEVALKIAFQYWRNKGRHEKTLFVTLDQAYHGDTIGSVSVGAIDLFHSIFHPLLFHTVSIPTPFPYAHPDLTPQQCRDRSLDAFADLAAQRSHEIVALMVEPLVQGAGGIIVHPEGFLKGLESICREHGILLICDEVATGFGRTGKMFACEHEDVRPDLLALAKGISAGYLPLAATMATDEVFDAFRGEYTDYKTFFHGHSYTGNALACAAACANLDLFERDRIIENLQPKIERLRSMLEDRVAPLAHVGDVRQRGLMVGIQLAKGKEERVPYDPADRMAVRVILNARKHGVIVRNLGDVVVLMPPLSITVEEIELLVSSVGLSVEEICGSR